MLWHAVAPFCCAKCTGQGAGVGMEIECKSRHSVSSRPLTQKLLTDCLELCHLTSSSPHPDYCRSLSREIHGQNRGSSESAGLVCEFLLMFIYCVVTCYQEHNPALHILKEFVLSRSHQSACKRNPLVRSIPLTWLDLSN